MQHSVEKLNEIPNKDKRFINEVRTRFPALFGVNLSFPPTAAPPSMAAAMLSPGGLPLAEPWPIRSLVTSFSPFSWYAFVFLREESLGIAAKGNQHQT